VFRRNLLVLADPAVRAVVGLAFLVLFGGGLALPIMPLFAHSFGVGNGGAGLLVGSFGFGRLLADVGGGILVDRIGARAAAAAGTVALALCSLGTALAPTFAAAVALWTLAGAASAVLFAALFSLALAVAPADQTATTLSLFYAGFNVGIVGGGVVGGFLADRISLAAPLEVNAALLVAVLPVLFLPSLAGARTPDRSAAPPLRALVVRTDFLRAVAANATYLWLVAAVFNTLVPLFGRGALGMSTTAIGGVIAIALATEFLALFPAGSAADRYGRRAVYLPTIAAFGVVTLLLGWVGSVAAFAVGLAVLGLASGSSGVPPAAMLADVLPEGTSGAAVGAFRFAGDVGLTLAPLATGFTSGAAGFRAAFAVAAAPAAFAVLLFLRRPETLRQPSEET
jgi:MFS family permease